MNLFALLFKNCARNLYRGILDDLAAAFATDKETDSMAFDPNFALFGVPSRSIIALSTV